MKKELYKIIFSIIIVISAISFIAPFSLKADSFPVAPFVAINWYIENYDNEYNLSLSNGTGTLTIDGSNSSIVQGPITTSNGVTYYSTGVSPSGNGLNLNGTISLNQNGSSTQVVKRVIHCDIILDDNYIGYINVNVKNSNNITYFSQELGVNGNTISFQFIDNEISNNVEYNINLTNIYLIQNNNNERWSFPVESFLAVNHSFSVFDINGFDSYNNYFYPIFKTIANTDAFTPMLATANDRYYKIIFFINKNVYSIPRINTFFETNGSIENWKAIQRNQNWTIVSLDLYNRTGNTADLYFKSKSEFLFIPIFHAYQNAIKNVSTDFALQFGFNNTLLDNLDIIANGNTNSNDSVSSADNTNSHAQSTFAQEEQLVSNAESDMQDNLDNLNIQNQNNNLFGNSNFIASANWVRTQFNYFTNNNAFNYLIKFSLVIGLSLVIIGKLRG